VSLAGTLPSTSCDSVEDILETDPILLEAPLPFAGTDSNDCALAQMGPKWLGSALPLVENSPSS
jgi:hypothetical protein